MMFSRSASEVRERMKTVGRRPGWRFLRPGDVVEACESGGVGAPPRRIAVLRIRNVRIEPLSRLLNDRCYAEDELPREGLPCWSTLDFVASFLRAHRLKTADTEITRIEFEYVD
jgi:hypothetical protein